MKNVENIELINLKKYKFYYAYPKPFDFELYTFSGNDYVKMDESVYDIFDGGDSLILAFVEPPPHISPYVCYLERDGSKQAIEFEYYSNIQELFGKVPPRASYLYWIMDSVIVTDKFTNDTYSAVSLNDRCDSKAPTYGPWRFEVSDGVKPTSYDYDKIPRSSWAGLVRLVSEPSNGHILRMTLVGDISGWKDWPLTTVAGTSMIEAIQLMRHWSALAQDPWNSNENTAIMSNKFNNALNLDEDIILELNQECPSTSVSNFVIGNENSREREDSSVVLGPEMAKFMLNRICHSSLSSLKTNSPYSIDIPQSILDQDIEKINIELYNSFIENEIDYTDKTAIELLNEVQEKIDSGIISNNIRKYEKALLNYIAIL